MKIECIPEPKRCVARRGELRLPIGAQGSETFVVISDEQARGPADLVAEKYKLAVRFTRTRPASGDETGGARIRLNIVKRLGFRQKLCADQCVEAYELKVSGEGVDISALTAEGLLRGAATLFQMTRWNKDCVRVPCVVIEDWPNFRYRCASDWLLNVECNRWAYDWGDGRDAFLARIRRKLDFCFEHKINMVWFDGFGWNTKRFPGYARLMRACTRYARRLGIKLLFAGYGGGYGTAYQSGEIYRYGYFGKVYLNRRRYPGGKIYNCCGGDVAGRYGTCPSNSGLKAAKIEEMKKFVSEVHPGFMYIHDIDAAGWLPVEHAWKQRCGRCRKLWPNDDLSAADGHAGAYAAWFKQVRRELSSLPESAGYSPARDLVLIFTSPLYTHYQERKPKNVWQREMEYFTRLSRLIGPEKGIEFGLREQFYDAGNRKKIACLRKKMERNGKGPGLHVIAFGGGDNYISDDLANISGAMAHFYDGAESVCLSNGGVHEEPVQVLNSTFLWSGSAGGYRENPANEVQAESVFLRMAAGDYLPAKIFAAGGYFEKVCIHLWGVQAGKLMSRALLVRLNGRMPVSRVWWSITNTVMALKRSEDWSRGNCAREWIDRERATWSALKLARQAAHVSANEDIHWFVKCLEVGRQFAVAVKLLVLLKSAKDQTAAVRLERVIKDVKARIRRNHPIRKTDILGGDPGCWLETIEEIERLTQALIERQKSGDVFGDFITQWFVSRQMPSAGKLHNLGCPQDENVLQLKPRLFPAAFCDAHSDLVAGGSADALVYFVNRFICAEQMHIELRLGYDGPVKAWLDGNQVLHDPNGTNPARADAAVIPWTVAKGKHELIVALGSNHGNAYGIFARFYRKNPRRSVQTLRSVRCKMPVVA